MPSVVRPVIRSDEEALFSLVVQFPTPTPCTRETFSGLFKSKVADLTACVLVAVEENRLAGYVSGSARPAFYAGGLTAWVDEILVVPDSRGRGMGAALMTAFEQWARERESRLVALATRGAVGFYERLGYASTAGYFKKYL